MASFTCFNHLPFELRLQVWELALPIPKVVEINLSFNKSPFANCPPPALLSVCSESRSVALKQYHASFVSKSFPAGVYIDPHLDTILLLPPCRATCYTMPNCSECVHFDYGSHLSGYDAEWAKEVRNVAIYSFGLEGLAGLWNFFPGVRTLSVVIDEFLTGFESRQDPLKSLLEDLVAKAEKDVPELAGKDAVEVTVMRIEEVTFAG
jgi:hypothetical protein